MSENWQAQLENIGTNAADAALTEIETTLLRLGKKNVIGNNEVGVSDDLYQLHETIARLVRQALRSRFAPGEQRFRHPKYP